MKTKDIKAVLSKDGTRIAYHRIGDGPPALAKVLPNARYLTLKGQSHMLKPPVHAPVLHEFFRD